MSAPEAPGGAKAPARRAKGSPGNGGAFPASRLLFGQCRHGLHGRCLGMVASPNGPVRCRCECHRAQSRCIECGARDRDIDLASMCCVDMSACQDRARARLEADPLHHKVQASLAAGRAEAGEERARRAPVAPRPQAGSCFHCGQPTKGGTFVAGHDAKHKSALAKAAAEGDHESVAEQILRGWDSAKTRLLPAWGPGLALAEQVAKDPAWLARRAAVQ